MSISNVTIYHSGFSLSLVWVGFSIARSLESFFVWGCLGGPLSTVGLLCILVCDNTACVACADPFIVPYTLSSLGVCRYGLLLCLESHCLKNNHYALLSSYFLFRHVSTNKEIEMCPVNLPVR